MLDMCWTSLTMVRTTFLLLHARNTACMLLHDYDVMMMMMIIILTTPVISSIDNSVGGGVDAFPAALRAYGSLREGLRHTPPVRGW